MPGGELQEALRSPQAAVAHSSHMAATTRLPPGEQLLPAISATALSALYAAPICKRSTESIQMYKCCPGEP